ncbi:MAG: YciI family protein [Bacteroidales bacterium]
MFIVLLTYTAPLEQVDRHVAAHRDWLAACYDDGIFLASGPQQPRVGGAILAHGLSRAELDRRLAADPFAQAGVANYQVVQMEVRLADARLAFLLPSEP